ncbi:hypothetical protein CEXT_499191 [Caerostris extrusa]|uniref:Uncharacterized protein n=1 Tax=Caerostris extrusa TaxID=172846 RepID=A0AAV4V7A2_CAEEX|nr:hypothetical protein CEXT_499191 [Caerostris extrusa]
MVALRIYLCDKEDKKINEEVGKSQVITFIQGTSAASVQNEPRLKHSNPHATLTVPTYIFAHPIFCEANESMQVLCLGIKAVNFCISKNHKRGKRICGALNHQVMELHVLTWRELANGEEAKRVYSIQLCKYGERYLLLQTR